MIQKVVTYLKDTLLEQQFLQKTSNFFVCKTTKKSDEEQDLSTEQ